MEFIIMYKNRKYSTKESTEIGVFLHDNEDINKRYTRTLYQSKYGDYFFLLSGGPDSPVGIRKNGRKLWGSRMFPIPEEKAKEFMNKEGVVLLNE